MKRRRAMAAAAAAVFMAGILSVPVFTAYAYLTDKTEGILNPFTIALDCTTTVVERYPVPDDDPPNTPVPEGSLISYEKVVQIGNTGYVDGYVRVSLDFSEQDIADKSQFSADGVNFYPYAEYKDHLPAGWAYDEADGFYYYKAIVYADRWNETAAKLTYDKALGEYFYPPSQEIIGERCITAPLIRYVRTEFDSPEDMRSYSLHVYSESVPFYFGNDYRQSWENYLAVMEP